MKFNKVLRNKLIVLFAMTAVFGSLAFSMTASAESLVNFSRGILSNVSFAANTSQSATPEPTPPKRNEKDENSESSNGNRTDRDDEGEEDDADIPKFMIGKINKEDYRAYNPSLFKYKNGLFYVYRLSNFVQCPTQYFRSQLNYWMYSNSIYSHISILTQMEILFI